MLPQWVRTIFVGLFFLCRYPVHSVCYNMRALTNTYYTSVRLRISNGRPLHTHTLNISMHQWKLKPKYESKIQNLCLCKVEKKEKIIIGWLVGLVRNVHAFCCQTDEYFGFVRTYSTKWSTEKRATKSEGKDEETFYRENLNKEKKWRSTDPTNWSHHSKWPRGLVSFAVFCARCVHIPSMFVCECDYVQRGITI